MSKPNPARKAGDTASTPGGKPDTPRDLSVDQPSVVLPPGDNPVAPVAPRDLLADAEAIRHMAQGYAAQGIWSCSTALEDVARGIEQLHQLCVGGWPRKKITVVEGAGPFRFETTLLGGVLTTPGVITAEIQEAPDDREELENARPDGTNPPQRRTRPALPTNQ